MTNQEISKMFLRDGRYHFARWSKSLCPVIFGADDDSVLSIKGAFSDVLMLTPLGLSEFDPNLGANLLVFFCSKWSELTKIPNLNRLIPDLSILLETLNENQANQYRTFSFTPDGAINIVVILLKYDEELASVSVQTLATSQMLQSILLWAPSAFSDESPLEVLENTNRCIIKPFYAALIKASYDPLLPDYSNDESHALRVAARVSLLLGDK